MIKLNAVIFHFHLQCTWMTMNNISTGGGLKQLKGFKDNIKVLVGPLTLILNQSFEQGISPEILKNVQVSSICKDTHCSSYCTISLLSVFSKNSFFCL